MKLHTVICVYNSRVKLYVVCYLFDIRHLGYHSELEGYLSSDDEPDDPEV